MATSSPPWIRRSIAADVPVAPRAWAGLVVVAAAAFVVSLDTMVLYVAFGDIRLLARGDPGRRSQPKSLGSERLANNRKEAQ